MNPEPQSLVTATLSITHAKNSNNNSEVWLSSSLGDIQIGILSDSNSTWFTDAFDLALIPGLFAEMESTSPWSLTIKLADTTNGADKIWMDKSVLSGTYEPVAQSTDAGDPELAAVAVPEPSTVILMSLGLAGVGFSRRRMKT